ncbi:hypothetical protein VXS06_14350 [Photobacterium toruni]|uniref:BppU N-terminal domain-containing protein n=1 Tax=Photobacterium toruni TaxID=1935446 RepID=A0ABU6LBD3_9GAMM|nr:hypothetical protein [Photobacterium toruni]
MSGKLDVKITEPDDLDLICDVQFAELFTSESINRKFFGVMTRGVYSGYNHEITRSFEVTIGSDGKRNTAVVDKKGISLTVQCKKPIKVTIPKGRKSYCVIEAFYEVGTITKQVKPDSAILPAQIKVIPTYELLPEHTILFAADVPAIADRVTEAMISIEERTLPEHYQRIVNLTLEFDQKLSDLRKTIDNSLENNDESNSSKIRAISNVIDEMKRDFESKIDKLTRTCTDISTNKYDKQGGTLSGDITFYTDHKIQWLRNTDGCFIKFNSLNDFDTQSCMEFGTLDNSNEGFKWTMSGNVAMTLFSDALKVFREIYVNGQKVYHTGNFKKQLNWGGIQITNYTNNMDGVSDWTAPNGAVIVGVYSYHDDKYEDRRFRYRYRSLSLS